MTFKPSPYIPGEVRPKRTPAQVAATQHNFRIFRLHGLHSQMGLLTGPRKAMARELVELELAALGAKTVAEAVADQRAKLLAKLNAQMGPPELEDDQPF